jgi:hypothetical protein
MKLYTAHRPPHAPRDRAFFIKDGFSWLAFLFPAVWLLVKRLWLAFACYVLAVAAIAAGTSAAGVTGAPVFALFLGLHLLIGFEASGLLRRALLRRGFTSEGPFLGDDIEQAEIRYFAPSPRAPSPSAGPGPPIVE